VVPATVRWQPGAGGQGGAGARPALAGHRHRGQRGGCTSAGANSGSCPDDRELPDLAPPARAPRLGKLAVTDFKVTTATAGTAARPTRSRSAWFGALRFTKLTADTATTPTLIQPWGLPGNLRRRLVGHPVDNSATPRRPRASAICAEISADMDGALQDAGTGAGRHAVASTDSEPASRESALLGALYMITGLQVEAYRFAKDTKVSRPRPKTNAELRERSCQQPERPHWHTMTVQSYWTRQWWSRRG